MDYCTGSRQRSIPVVPLLVLAVLAPALVLGCGEEPAVETDPEQLLDETFTGQRLDSGMLEMSYELSISGSVEGSSAATANGPFEGGRGNTLPAFDIAVTFEEVTEGLRDFGFEGGATATVDGGYLEFQGESFELDPAVVKRIMDPDPLARVDVARWLIDPSNEGTADIDGTETVHVSGEADVRRVFADVDRVAEAIGIAESDLARGAERGVTEATVDVFTGADDRILRRLAVRIEFKGDLEGGEDLTGVHDYSVTFSDVNADQEIEPPEDARPFDEVVDQLPLELSGLGEFLNPRPADEHGPAVTVKCEGLGPGPGWRRRAVDVGRFGLLGPNDLSSAVELRNGNFLAKRGAVVVGQAPVTVRVPDAAQGRVGVVYGDASRGRGRRLSEAPVEVTFRPCFSRPRSGYVGGVLLETVGEPLRLEVELSDSRTERLTIQPGM